MSTLPSLLAQAETSGENPGMIQKIMEFFQDFFSSGAIGIFLEGGIFMWPILILLILVLAVVIERYRSLKMLEVDSSKLREEITELLSEDKSLVPARVMEITSHEWRSADLVKPERRIALLKRQHVALEEWRKRTGTLGGSNAAASNGVPS